jgi:hypothetical protein
MADFRELLNEIEEESPKKKGEYKPSRGEEAIFERKSGVLERAAKIPFLGGLLEQGVPGFEQIAQDAPWRDPQGSLAKSLMQVIGAISSYSSGSLMRGNKSRIALALKKLLTNPEEASMFIGQAVKPKVAAEKGGELMLSPRGFQMRQPQEINIPSPPRQPEELAGRAQGQIAGAIERQAILPTSLPPKGKPRTFALERKGFKTKRGAYQEQFDMPPVPKMTKPEIEYIKNKAITERMSDVIEELLGANLKLGGF